MIANLSEQELRIMDNLRANIAKVILKRRMELLMPQGELAKLVGFPQSAISRMEKGKYNFTLGSLAKILCGLNMEIIVHPRVPGVVVSITDSKHEAI